MKNRLAKLPKKSPDKKNYEENRFAELTLEIKKNGKQ